MSEASGDTKPCPMCGATIKAAARKCRFCGEGIAPPSQKPTELRITANWGMAVGALAGMAFSFACCGGLGQLVGGFTKLGFIGIGAVSFTTAFGSVVGAITYAALAAKKKKSINDLTKK